VDDEATTKINQRDMLVNIWQISPSIYNNCITLVTIAGIPAP
jgi:hypothetical protein